MQKKRPTIKDVAFYAGVSKSTVSLVLQSSPLVKDETRKTVQEAMVALNFVRNRAAATLRGSASGLIGLVINDLRNPFFTEFATSAQMALSARGYVTVIANSNEDAALQEQVIASILEHDVSALLISPSYGDSAQAVHAMTRDDVPVLQVLRKLDGADEAFPFLSLDYEAGGRMAVQHLLDQGVTEIAFVGGQEGRQITQERMAGYLDLLASHGLKHHIFAGRPTRAFGRGTALEIRRTHPEIQATLCFNDLVALGMAAGFAQAQVTVGRDILLVGFDDIEECALVYPQLSSVRCDIESFGRLSAKMLIDWLETGVRPDAPSRVPVELIIRQSSQLDPSK